MTGKPYGSPTKSLVKDPSFDSEENGIGLVWRRIYASEQEPTNSVAEVMGVGRKLMALKQASKMTVGTNRSIGETSSNRWRSRQYR